MKILPCQKIQIEITNVCNYNCDICPRQKLKVPLKHMSIEIFKKILVNIRNIKSVDLTGWGEPLCHPDFLELLKLAKSDKKKVTFTTNASLLQPSIIQKLNEYGLDGLALSLDNMEQSSSHGADSIAQKIKLLEQLKAPLRFQTTLFGQDIIELSKIANLAIKCGAVEYRLIRLDQRLLNKSVTLGPEKDIYFELKKKFAGEIKVTMAQLGIYGDWRDHMYRPVHNLIGSYCPKLLQSAYVNVNGYLTPCCSLPHKKIGDLKKESIEALWGSAEFKKFRANHSLYCDNCQVLTR